MSDERTERGFRIFATINTTRGAVRVQESSAAFEGAHCWVFPSKENNQIHVNVAQAKELIAGLQAFVDEAEADKLTEPVQRNEDLLSEDEG